MLLSKVWPGAVLQDVYIMKNILLYFVIYTFQTILEWKNTVKNCKIDTDSFTKLWCLESYPKLPHNQCLIFKSSSCLCDFCGVCLFVCFPCLCEAQLRDVRLTGSVAELRSCRESCPAQLQTSSYREKRRIYLALTWTELPGISNWSCLQNADKFSLKNWQDKTRHHFSPPCSLTPFALKFQQW